MGRGKRLLVASITAIVVSVPAAPAPSLAAGPVYDPSSPAGDQYSDPFERGRSAGGGDRSAPDGAAPSGAPAAGVSGMSAPPTRQASAVLAFGAGVTRRAAAGSAAGGSAAPSHADADRAASDRVLAAREIGSVDSSATGDLLLIAGVSAALVLGAALLARLRRRSGP